MGTLNGPWVMRLMWMCVYHRIDSKKSVCPWVELLLQGDHNDLAALSGHHSEKSCNLQGNNVFLSLQIKNIKTACLRHWGLSYFANVCVVQGSIHFIQHKERGRTKAKIKQQWSLQFSPTSKTSVFIVRYYFTRSRSMCLCCFSPVNGKDQSESSDGLLSSWQVVHGHESFPRSHTVIVDAIQVGLIWILRTENGLKDMCVQKVSYNN